MGGDDTMKRITIFLLIISTLSCVFVNATQNKEQVNKQLVQNILNTAYSHLKTCEQEYKAVSEKFNREKPFIKLQRRLEPCMDMLNQLYKEYGLKPPRIAVSVKAPETLDDYYKYALEKEKNMLETYRGFLKEEMPQDVRSAVHKLMELSATMQKYTGSSLRQNKLNKARS